MRYLYRDVVNSKGEVDARSESKILTFESREGNPIDHHVHVGDVLVDPKFRVYGVQLLDMNSPRLVERLFSHEFNLMLAWTARKWATIPGQL